MAFLSCNESFEYVASDFVEDLDYTACVATMFPTVYQPCEPDQTKL